MHLSLAEDGAYSRLLRFYYKTRVPLPDDDRALAAIARVSGAEWDAIKETIRAFFKPRRGRLHHKRCDAELDREDSFAKKRSDHAKRAIAKRWARSRSKIPPVYEENTQRSDSAIPEDTTRPDQTREDQTEKKEEPPQAPRKRVACLSADQSKIFEEWYATYPLHKARLAAEKAFLAALARASPAELLMGAARYRDECAGKEPRYIAHPASWLNAGRWKDELPSTNGTIHSLSEHRRPTAPPPAHLLTGDTREGQGAA
jgi:uncharacterized protein YdaU (DUF1376 family)